MFFRKKDVNINVKNKKLALEAKNGVNLYKFLADEGVIDRTLCNGSGVCGKCKIRFTGGDIPKPTNKDKLILAKVNIDSGYRLACQHNIKNNIEIDTGTILSSNLYDSTTKSGNELNVKKVKRIVLDNNDIGDIDIPQADDLEQISISEFSPMKPKEPTPDHTVEGPSDGIFLVQQKRSVRYFCYSAALDNIVSEGTSQTAELLRDVIDNGLVSDFIHDVLKIKDVDRVLILIEPHNDYNTTDIIDLIKYFKFELGTLLCEVIMPSHHNYDVVKFFRLLSINKSKHLVFFLDMLDSVYYFNDNLLADMRYSSLKINNLLSIKEKGRNAITALETNLNVKSVERAGEAPDSITITALLEAVKILKANSIIDNNFKIKPRSKLIEQKTPLELSVRVTGKEESNGFYIYRDRFSEIQITKEELDILSQLKAYINSVIKYASARISVVEGLSFYTNTNNENLINLMIDLSIIPKEFAGKVSYYPGESTVNAIKLFKEKDIHSYVKSHLGNVKKIELENDDIFKTVSEETGLQD